MVGALSAGDEGRARSGGRRRRRARPKARHDEGRRGRALPARHGDSPRQEGLGRDLCRGAEAVRRARHHGYHRHQRLLRPGVDDADHHAGGAAQQGRAAAAGAEALSRRHGLAGKSCWRRCDDLSQQQDIDYGPPRRGDKTLSTLQGQTMKKLTLVLSIMLVAAVSTTADAAKHKRKAKAAAPTPAAAVSTDTNAQSAKLIQDALNPWGAK